MRLPAHAGLHARVQLACRSLCSAYLRRIGAGEARHLSSSQPTCMCARAQACSILYKTRLPLLLVFNKTDCVRHEFAQEWMRDQDAFSAALQQDTSYAATLSRSLSLVCLASAPAPSDKCQSLYWQASRYWNPWSWPSPAQANCASSTSL